MGGHYKGGGDKTVAKLVTLEKYVNAYVAIMKNQWSYGQVWYIDTHAGTGYVDMEEFGAEIPGSAVRIIHNHRDDFDRFYFYEADSERFDLLQQTLATEFDIEFDSWETDAGFLVYSCDDPRIRLFRTNSNEGIQWLTRKAKPNHHWFVFMDPHRVRDLEADAIDAVTTRGNADILINFQTTSVHRAANWNPSRDSVERLGGVEPLDEGELSDQVGWFRDAIEKSSKYDTASRKTISETDKRHRFDLVFGSANDTAVGIMDEIMNKSLKKDIVEEIKDSRSEDGQQGLENWHEIKFIEHGAETEAESHRDKTQSGLSEY